MVSMPYHRPQAYYEAAAWRGTWNLDGGGALMNQGIHLLDLLVWFMGDPVAVEAYAGTLDREIEVEDTLVANLRFCVCGRGTRYRNGYYHGRPRVSAPDRNLRDPRWHPGRGRVRCPLGTF